MRPRKKKFDARSPEYKTLDAWIPSDPNRPYYGQFRDAFIQRFARWFACATDAARVDETKCLEKEWRTLSSLLFRYPAANRNHDWRKLNPEPQIVRVLRHALRVAADYKSKGRPADSRRAALVALDLHTVDPKRWTWRSITNHLCNCGLREHPYRSKCQTNLCREVLHLKKYLQTLQNPADTAKK